ncbi:Hypothetical predicted protein [Olea europaea subsp. europaea]|uniref:Helicase ATP-binding domain-containing protein n=1 Tax=Olea europaea subsp. europaea TaxID=158383 RepID=A0A8S0UZM8_OLEEU|nr:Hypothetical predicted protein [Olea europaea subsp. europaea]
MVDECQRLLWPVNESESESESSDNGELAKSKSADRRKERKADCNQSSLLILSLFRRSRPRRRVRQKKPAESRPAMSLAKVSLLSELSLLPLRRLLKLNLGDTHYQLVTQEYCTQLRHLYHSSLEERRRAQRAEREAHSLSEESFRLSLGPGEELRGIKLARASLPRAERGDQVQLVRVVEGAPGELVTRGSVDLVTQQQVQIKFQEPLKGPAKKLAEAVEAKSPVADSKEAQQKTESNPEEVKLENGIERAAEKQETSEKREEQNVEQQPEVIDFKIRFVFKQELGNLQAQINSRDDEDYHTNRLIEEILHNFQKLKCNQALHKNLMGIYDERSDLMVNDRTRVLTTLGAELRLRPNGQQRAAIEQALKRRLTLVEGPAGSGKTLVAALIAANACRLRQSRVLVCSPIQATVNKLTELLLDLVGGLQVIKLPEDANAKTRNSRPAPLGRRTSERRPRGSRAGSSSASSTLRKRNSYLDGGGCGGGVDDDDYALGEQLANEASRCHLDKIVDDEIYLEAYARSKDTLGHSHEQLHAHAYRMVSGCSLLKRREMELKMISKANVVCCTTVQAGSYLLKGSEFDLLILDDQHVTSELDSLVAIMTKGIKQVTLLSDTRRRIRLARSRLSARSSKQRLSTAKPQQQQQQPLISGDASASSRNSVVEQQPTASTPTSDLTNSDSLRRKGQVNGTSSRTRRRPSLSSSSSSSGSSSGPVSFRGSQKSKSLPNISLEPGNLFERLLSVGLPTVDLRIQYRCHSVLSNFFGHHFYAGRLKDDRRAVEKLSAEIESSLLLSEENFSWLPNRKYLTAMFNVDSQASDSATEKSDNQNHNPNALEVKVEEIINRLLVDENIQESRVGVIYNRHSLVERARQRSSGLDDLKRSTIDGFIGQDKDFVILVAGGPKMGSNDNNNLSGTSSDAKSHLGMTSEIQCDFRNHDVTLNWALTRAKLGLFLVTEDVDLASQAESNGKGDENGEATTSTTENVVAPPTPGTGCPSWLELVRYYVDNKLAVDS